MQHDFTRKLQRSISHDARPSNGIVVVTHLVIRVVVLAVVFVLGASINTKALNQLKGIYVLMIRVRTRDQVSFHDGTQIRLVQDGVLLVRSTIHGGLFQHGVTRTTGGGDRVSQIRQVRRKGGCPWWF